MENIADYWQAFMQTELYRELVQVNWEFVCPLIAIGLAVCAFVVEQLRRYKDLRPMATVFSMMLLPPLLVVAVLAMGNYNDFGKWRYGSFFNAYEFYHYYIGSKYAPEIHYKDLYSATLIADAETGLKFQHVEGTIKNLNPKWKEMGEPYRMSVKEVLKNKDKVKANFTPERWDEFVGDISFFKKELIGSRWNGVLRDKGYNGSPAWSTVVGGLLSNNFPTSNRSGMVFLASLDLILIGIAMLFVWWAFGLRPALLMLVLLGTSYVMSFSHMKGAYLRTDFTMPIIISICLIKKNRYAPAGALMGYASVARVFPAVFLFGMGARMLWVTLREINLIFREREGGLKPGAAFMRLLKVNRPYIAFFVCVVVAVVVMLILPVAYTGDMGLWISYKDKIGDHADDISPWRVGFKYAFIANVLPQKQLEKALEGTSFFSDPVKYIDAHVRHTNVVIVSKRYTEERQLWLALMAFMLAVCLLATRGLKDHDAVAFSFVPCFFLASPTYYYYIMLLIPMLFFAPYLNRPGRLLGAVALLALAMPGYYLYSIWRQQFPTYYWHSVMYFWLCAYMVMLALYDTFWAFIAGTPFAPYKDDREWAQEKDEDTTQDESEIAEDSEGNLETITPAHAQ